jgi:uncharacterized protein (TIGR02996 family)
MDARERQFRDLLAQNPDDKQTRLTFADYLEEMGHPTADLHRDIGSADTTHLEANLSNGNEWSRVTAPTTSQPLSRQFRAIAGAYRLLSQYQPHTQYRIRASGKRPDGTPVDRVISDDDFPELGFPHPRE